MSSEAEIDDYFQWLPNEIIIRIFQNLNHYDILSSSQVCRRFLNILQHPNLLLQTKLKLNNVQDLGQSPENLLTRSLRCFPNIHLENSHVGLFGSLLFQMHLHIHSLTFESLELTEEQIFKILHNASNLVELKLKKCSFYGEDYLPSQDIYYHKLSKLKVLLLLDIPHDSRSTLLKISNLIPLNNLETFEITVSKSLNELVVICCNLILPILINHAESLKHIKISNFQNCCKQNIFKILSKNKNNLQHLSIVHTNSVADADIVFLIENFKFLRSFELKSCHNLTNVSAIAIGDLSFLENLTISECSGIITGINSGGIKNGILKKVNPKLKKLNLIFLDINTDCMIKMSENLPNLKELIYRYPIITGRIQCKITDYALQAIIKNLKHLEILDLFGCSWLTDFGITGYDEETEKQEGVSINQLQNLEILNLIGCSKITDLFILNNFQLEKLRILKIPEISLTAIRILVEKCKFIEELEFQNDFDTEEILYLAIKYFVRLRTIKIMRFCSFSKKLMKAKIQRFNQIQGFVGFDCTCSTCNRVKLLCDVFKNRN